MVADLHVRFLKMKKETKIRLITSMCDDQIAPIVHDLMVGDIKTFASCEGGPGHSFTSPIVRVDASHTRDKIHRVLQKAGYDGYNINGQWITEHGKLRLRFWEVEFWVRDPRADVHLTYGLWDPAGEIKRLKINLYHAMVEVDLAKGHGE